jgi:hypothetical protein
MKANQLKVGQKFRLTKDTASTWQVVAQNRNKTSAICLSGPVKDKIVAMGRNASTPITIPSNNNVGLDIL